MPDEKTVVQRGKGQSLMVKGLVTGLTEVGKIKIGIKGREITSQKGKSFQPPQKLDHFLVTTLQRGPDGNYLKDEHIHALYGEEPRKLPILLVYDDPELNWQSRYVAFKGKVLWCSGDGETAQRLSQNGNAYVARECPCPLQNPEHVGTDAQPKCKISGVLSCLIAGCESVGGVYKARTTSYNSVVGITSSMALLQRLTCGPLAGLPLNLTINPKTVVAPGTNHTQTIFVLGLEYPGSLDQLREIAFERAKQTALYGAKLDQLESMARRVIGAIPLIAPEEQAEIAEEFYPEQVVIEMAKKDGVHQAAEKPPEKPEETKQEARPETKPETKPEPKPEPEKPKARRRTKEFTGLNPEVFADGKIATCGINPSTIMQLRKLAQAIPENRAKIQERLKAIGYDALSFLRQDEGEELLLSLQPLPVSDPVPPPEPEQSTQESPPELEQGQPETEQAAEQKPDQGEAFYCPMVCEKGETVYRTYCMETCDIRRADGFCGILGETPPGELAL